MKRESSSFGIKKKKKKNRKERKKEVRDSILEEIPFFTLEGDESNLSIEEAAGQTIAVFLFVLQEFASWFML